MLAVAVVVLVQALRLAVLAVEVLVVKHQVVQLLELLTQVAAVEVLVVVMETLVRTVAQVL